jgi:hypothetical protein
MKEVIEIIFKKNGSARIHPQRGDDLLIEVAGKGLGKQLVAFCAERGLGTASLILYLDEDLLYFKKFQLPLKTANLKEAVGYQLGLLAPFVEPCLHSFTEIRKTEAYDVLLYAIQAVQVESMVEDLLASGFQVTAVFPESQRYVSGKLKKTKWALLLGDRSPKMFSFEGNQLQDRVLCRTVPSFEDVITFSGAEIVFSSGRPEDDRFQQLDTIEKTGRKQFNLLPASYRRPDFFRMILIVLVVLNILAGISVAGIKGYQVWSRSKSIEAEITSILPQVKETEALRVREKSLEKSITRFENLGRNFDMIRFLKKLTTVLPKTAYLDQIRMDKKTGTIHLQGFTENISMLTKELQELGDTTLKSTRRRKNKTYFHVEISRK